MEAIYEFLKSFIDPVYTGSFILISYALRNVIGDVVKKITKKDTKRKYGVFLIGLILGFVFFKLNPDGLTSANLIKKLIASYAIGTSLYELIIKWVIDTFSKKLNVKLDPEPKNE